MKKEEENKNVFIVLFFFCLIRWLSLLEPSIAVNSIIDSYYFPFMPIRRRRARIRRERYRKNGRRRDVRTCFLIQSPLSIVDFVIVKAVRCCNRQGRKKKSKKKKKKMSDKKETGAPTFSLILLDIWLLCYSVSFHCRHRRRRRQIVGPGRSKYGRPGPDLQLRLVAMMMTSLVVPLCASERYCEAGLPLQLAITVVWLLFVVLVEAKCLRNRQPASTRPGLTVGPHTSMQSATH